MFLTKVKKYNSNFKTPPTKFLKKNLYLKNTLNSEPR